MEAVHSAYRVQDSMVIGDLDTPEASETHAKLIQEKLFLREIYKERYRFFQQQLQSAPPGVQLEIGSGGGFIKEILPQVITTDVVALSTTDVALSALQLPFPAQSVSALMMINVLHHLQDVRAFFREVDRSLLPQGKLLMVEPANTLFSRFIYKNFHHEPFEPQAKSWELAEGGRMSMANDALPWIVFCRDRQQFEAEFPRLKIKQVKVIDPISYLISGGLSRPSMLPVALYPLVKLVEKITAPLHPLCGLFMEIVIEKK